MWTVEWNYEWNVREVVLRLITGCLLTLRFGVCLSTPEHWSAVCAIASLPNHFLLYSSDSQTFFSLCFIEFNENVSQRQDQCVGLCLCEARAEPMFRASAHFLLDSRNAFMVNILRRGQPSDPKRKMSHKCKISRPIRPNIFFDCVSSESQMKTTDNRIIGTTTQNRSE